MPVYVDNMQATYGRMKMCHMLADTTEELLAMVDQIGVDRRWIQKPGTPYEHFDIAMTKRARAIEAGAIAVSKRDIGMLIRKRRGRSYDPASPACQST